jgi:hypothetical protein
MDYCNLEEEPGRRASAGKSSMSEEELKFPEWQAPLQELLLEFDRERLVEKVAKVEALIFERLQRPGKTDDDRAERESMKQAVFILRMVKRDRLGFPDWK